MISMSWSRLKRGSQGLIASQKIENYLSMYRNSIDRGNWKFFEFLQCWHVGLVVGMNCSLSEWSRHSIQFDLTAVIQHGFLVKKNEHFHSRKKRKFEFCGVTICYPPRMSFMNTQFCVQLRCIVASIFMLLQIAKCPRHLYPLFSGGI